MCELLHTPRIIFPLGFARDLGKGGCAAGSRHGTPMPVGVGPVSLELAQRPLRLALRQPPSNHRVRYLPLVIKLVALGPLVLPPANRRLELLPPHFLGAISGSRDGGQS
jgi:hypothetical protein